MWAGGTTSTILWSVPRGFVRITTTVGGNPAVNGTLPLGTLTLHCNCTEYCKTGLNFTTAEYTKEGGGTIYAEVQNGTFACEAAAVPDLIVESITANCGYLFANESNEICAKITNNGAATGASNTRFVINGYSGVVEVPALAAGANTTVCVTDPTIRTVDDVVTITVTADCNGEVSESDETNNVTIQSETVVNNGYKGKTYTGGSNITTWQFYDQAHINLTYSIGDSKYQGGYNTPWTTYTANWTASDLPIPSGATIKKAVLYAYYTFDRTPAGNVTDYFTLSFNDNVVPIDQHYTDRKGYGSYNYPYGMVRYNVTAGFVAGSNNADLSNAEPTSPHHVSLSGMVLMVVYEHAGEPMRTIWLNEGFDIISARTSYCVTSEEATAYVPFTGGTIGPDTVDKATLVTMMQDAFDGDDKNRLYFNGGQWNGIWDTAAKQGDTAIAINETDVLAYLDATDNEACLQSHIPEGETKGDGMGAANAFLVVEYGEELPPSEYTIKIDDYTLALYDGGEVIVPVEILNATDIAGGSANILFNASVVNVKAVSAGHFGTPVPHIDNTNGSVHIAASSATAVGMPEAVLANIVFKGVSEGCTDLNIEDASLNFQDGNTTIPATISGSITVETWMLGDLNHNDMIDTGDATLVLRMVVGLEPTNMLGDMNHNGMIDTGDATLILRTVVGLPVP